MSTNLNLLADLHGAVCYNMTNDYLFRAVFQSNDKALRGLVCSLLHLKEEDVASITVINPIVLGEALTEKEFRLDIHVLLNDNILIDLEMQVANRLNWRERSVSYLCRSFDNLDHGQDYREAKSAIHIGFLDYTIFPEHPKFYDIYKLLSIHDHKKYSDSLTLSVVDLSRTDLATEEDKKYHIDDWAKLFKATTWEEINMIASKSEYLQEAAKSIRYMTAEEQVRKRCREREEYYQDLQNYAQYTADLEHAIAEKDSTIAEKDAQIRRLREELDALKK